MNNFKLISNLLILTQAYIYKASKLCPFQLKIKKNIVALVEHPILLHFYEMLQYCINIRSLSGTLVLVMASFLFPLP